MLHFNLTVFTMVLCWDFFLNPADNKSTGGFFDGMSGQL